MKDATAFALSTLLWDETYRPVIGEALNGEFFLLFDCLRDDNFRPAERRDCVRRCIAIARALRILRYLPGTRGVLDRRGTRGRPAGYRPSLTRPTFNWEDLLCCSKSLTNAHSTSGHPTTS